IRDWDRNRTRYWPGVNFGIRLYSLDGIRFARCVAQHHDQLSCEVFNFFVVSRSDYLSLFRKAQRLRQADAKALQPPVLPDGVFETLHRNTLGYLRRRNLKRIRELGGRPRRGLLLSGPPGNGKTSVCRWLWKQCHRLNLEFRIVTPDA